MFSVNSGLQVQTVQWPLLLNWRKGKKMPTGQVFGRYTGQVYQVVIDGMVYVRSSDGYGTITQYNPENGNWSQLPTPPVMKYFGMTFEDQLVLVSGCVEGQSVLARGLADYPDLRITVWDSGKGRWVHPYPPIPTARYNPAAVGYQKHLIVAGGNSPNDEVEVLDSSSGKWHTPEPLPVECSP